MSYKRHNKSIALWFSAIGFFGLMTLILLASVAQADETGVRYTDLSKITLLSRASDGQQGNTWSRYDRISSNGEFVTFASLSSNLVPGNIFGQQQIYAHEVSTGKTTRVSVSSLGEVANAYAWNASISADGRYVVFDSTATNLDTEDKDQVADVFVHDRQTGQTRVLPVVLNGVEGTGDSGGASISADGRYVTYLSKSFSQSNLITNVFLYDREDNASTAVSLAANGKLGNGNSWKAVISDDGRYVAFSSAATNLVANDTNNADDIFLYDRQTGVVERVSISTSGTQATSPSSSPSISADGRYVAFKSFAPNLVAGDTNSDDDVFVRDRNSGTTVRVSVSSTGVQANAPCDSPMISGDGRYVTFDSKATTLVEGDANNYNDVFVHDLTTGETTAISLVPLGANGYSVSPHISYDGRFISFTSGNTHIVPDDTNQADDVFLYDREGGLVSGYTISGKVSQPDGILLEGVKVSINGTEYTTDALGRYTASGLVAGTYQVTATSATAILTPMVQTVTIPPSNTEVNFSQVCVSPYTGLNVCDLEVGDILFYSHAEYLESIIAKNLVGTYWFHAALYIGSDSIVHAQGRRNNPEIDVLVQPIAETEFWKGISGQSSDWAVLRPKASPAQKQGAVDYAIEKANDPAVTYIRNPASIPGFFDRGTDNEFACSELVWKAYQVNGYVMEVEASLWRWLYPQYDLLVTPDDLYFSPYFGKSDIVQQKQDNTTTEALKKVLFYLLSPADLLLTDGQGKRVGSNPTTGEEFAELPNAWHYNQPGLPEVIVMQAREGDTWTLQTTGTGEGNYTVQVVTYGATSVITQTTTLTTTVGKVDTFSVTLEAGNTGNEPIKLTHESTTLPTDKRFIYLPLIKR